MWLSWHTRDGASACSASLLGCAAFAKHAARFCTRFVHMGARGCVTTWLDSSWRHGTAHGSRTRVQRPSHVARAIAGEPRLRVLRSF
jgi:hypothetical protein